MKDRYLFHVITGCKKPTMLYIPLIPPKINYISLTQTLLNLMISISITEPVTINFLLEVFIVPSI